MEAFEIDHIVGETPAQREFFETLVETRQMLSLWEEGLLVVTINEDDSQFAGEERVMRRDNFLAIAQRGEVDAADFLEAIRKSGITVTDTEDKEDIKE